MLGAGIKWMGKGELPSFVFKHFRKYVFEKVVLDQH